MYHSFHNFYDLLIPFYLFYFIVIIFFFLGGGGFYVKIIDVIIMPNNVSY